jgi:hypothetical protein
MVRELELKLEDKNYKIINSIGINSCFNSFVPQLN